ncbi:MAG: choice-of-anchor L domain-containing protein [Bacteroidota bacterium]
MRKLILLSFTLLPFCGFSQLVVDNTTNTPTWLVQNVLAGAGVTISNVTLNGAPATSVSNTVGSFDGTASNIGLANGVIMGSGDVQVAVGPNNSGSATLGGGGIPGTDPDLQAITPNQIYDEAILEFDFIPIGDSVKFRYVFSSEEYDEYVCGSVNDAFGFFLSGPGITGPYTNGAINIAIIPGTSTPVSINTVNLGVAGANGFAGNCAAIDPNWASYNVFYAGTNTQNSVQYDGFTVVLEARGAVQCGQQYHIKLAIGDAGDGIFDSGVFLEGGSFTSQGVDVSVSTVTGDTTIVEGCTSDAIFYFTRPDTTTQLTIGLGIGGDAINGTDYTFIPDSISFNIGEDTVILQVSPFADALTEGVDTLIITVYTITACGDTIPEVATLLIFDPTAVTANAGPDQTSICPGDNITLNGSGTGGYQPYDYSWSTGNTSPSVTVSPLITTEYYLTVSDLCGMSGTDTVLVTVPVFVPFVINTSDTSIVCPGDNAVLLATVSSGGFSPYSYLWSNADTDTTTTVSPNVTTTYTFTVTDNCGMDSTVNVTVNVPVYNLQIAAPDVTGCMEEPIMLTSVVSGGAGGYVYAWTGSGTITVNQANGSATVPDALTGIYVVGVIDQCGNTDSDTANVVMNPCEITIPNVFSPNGDGINDVFYIDNLEYHPNSILIVYNRWGQIVFESSSYLNNWNGDGVSDGVYYYILKKTDPDAQEYNGNVTILGSK